MSGDSRCPFCTVLIDPGDFPWICQVCGWKHEHHGILLNCENCHYSPRVIRCPSCERSFEAFLLIGSFEGAPKELVPPQAILDASDCLTLHSQDLMSDPGLSLGRVFKIVRTWKEEVTFALCTVTFPFPRELSSLIWYDAFQSPNGRCWLHGWLFEQSQPTLGQDESVGQLSTWYPPDEGHASGNNRAGFKLTDIMIEHD